EGVVGPAFRRVDLPNAQRGGILSQASVLAVTSYPTRTSVVLRGKYIIENILAPPPPPPPPNVPPLDDDPTNAARSCRPPKGQHPGKPSCAICHSKIDPLGFALENYDAIGKWRATDVNLPVDAAGVLLDGTRFNGPSEFREAVAGRLP